MGRLLRLEVSLKIPKYQSPLAYSELVCVFFVQWNLFFSGQPASGFILVARLLYIKATFLSAKRNCVTLTICSFVSYNKKIRMQKIEQLIGFSFINLANLQCQYPCFLRKQLQHHPLSLSLSLKTYLYLNQFNFPIQKP